MCSSILIIELGRDIWNACPTWQGRAVVASQATLLHVVKSIVENDMGVRAPEAKGVDGNSTQALTWPWGTLDWDLCRR